MKEEEEFKYGNDSKRVRMLSTTDDTLRHILEEIQDIKTCMSSRLSTLEVKVSVLVQTCNKICTKLDIVEKNTSIERDLDNDDPLLGNCKNQKSRGELKLIPLSSESNYPDGSWLGDPKSSSTRVRCPIRPQNLHHINYTCSTPEKMALVLLDNMFTKDELSVSNVSGRGRWGKKQLDPLLMYGIKAHLQYKFMISDKDWQKICQNIDAKCRFARRTRFKRRQKDVCTNLTSRIKIMKDANMASHSSETIPFDFDSLNASGLDFNSCVKVISANPCELRIVNATAAQIAHLQESNEIILAEEILQHETDEKSIMISNTSGEAMSTVVLDESLEDDGEMEHVVNLDQIECDKEVSSDLRLSIKEELSIHCESLDNGLQQGILKDDAEDD